MENCFSLKNMVKNVFTEGSSTFRGFDTSDTIKSDIVPTNTIRQALAISDDSVKIYDPEACKDAKLRVKETEKNISKNILYSIYTFYIMHGREPTYDGLVLGQPFMVNTYDYTNLDSTSVPTFDKLDMEMDAILNTLSNYGTSGVEDKSTMYYNSLDKLVQEISDLMPGVPALVMNGKESNVTRETFILNAYKLFRGGSSFKPRSFMSDSSEMKRRYSQIYDNYLNLSAGVASYNEKLADIMAKLDKVCRELSKTYHTYNDQLTAQIKYKKEELANTLNRFACKYFTYANMLYSIKADAIREYLNPSENEDGRYTKLTHHESMDELFDDDMYLNEDVDMSDISTTYEFTDRMNYLEAEFIGYLTQEIINEGNEQQPQQQQQAQGQQATAAQAPNTNNQQNNGGGKVVVVEKEQSGILNVLKTLWNTIVSFFTGHTQKVMAIFERKNREITSIIGDDNKVTAIKQSLMNNGVNSKKSYQVSITPEQIVKINNTFKFLRVVPLNSNLIDQASKSDNLFTTLIPIVLPNFNQAVQSSGLTSLSGDDSEKYNSLCKMYLSGEQSTNANSIDEFTKNKDNNGGFSSKQISAQQSLLNNFDQLIASLKELDTSINIGLTNINNAITTTKNNITAAATKAKNDEKNKANAAQTGSEKTGTAPQA